MLSAILIGNNLVNTFLASLSSMIAYRFGGYAVSIATFLSHVSDPGLWRDHPENAGDDQLVKSSR